MNSTSQILEAFLSEKLVEHGLSLSPNTLARISHNVSLVEREGELHEETRTIKFAQDSSGNISASSFKLWNIAQVSIYDLLMLIGGEVGIGLFIDTAKETIFALGILLAEFYPKLKVNFKEQEAEVLFAIAQLQQKNFKTNQLQAKYYETFEKVLDIDRLEKSLDLLTQHQVLKRTALQQYEIKEKIKNLSRD